MSVDELIWYCLDNAEEIYVREQVDGEWKSVTFASLPTERRIELITAWHNSGHVPHVVTSEVSG